VRFEEPRQFESKAKAALRFAWLNFRFHCYLLMVALGHVEQEGAVLVVAMHFVCADFSHNEADEITAIACGTLPETLVYAAA
jgi:hypothetical protein